MPAAAFGQDEAHKAPLEFTESDPLAITADDLERGVTAELASNVTRRLRVRIRLSDLTLPVEALSVTPKLVLAKAGTGPVHIGLRPKVELTPGSYSGQSVSVRARRGDRRAACRVGHGPRPERRTSDA